jgi:hypothetical protein
MSNRFGAYGACERQAEYNRLRNEGLTSWDAVLELGLDPQAAGRYERWRLAGVEREDSQESHARRVEAKARQGIALPSR